MSGATVKILLTHLSKAKFPETNFPPEEHKHPSVHRLFPGAFAQLRKATISFDVFVSLSFCSHGITWFLLDGLS